LEKLQVGHAGLYVDEAVDVDEAVEYNNHTMIIARDIELEEEEGQRVQSTSLISCEATIINTVKKLAEADNHLPNKINGVWVYYLTKGLIDDFNRTWSETPYCLQPKKTKIEKSKEKGKRVLSKKEKNELVAKIDLLYYEKDISSGKITFEEAQKLAKEAYDTKQELENAGYFISTKKTEGVSLFDWKNEVRQKLGDDDSVLKIYSRHSIIPLVPCLENKLDKLVINPKVKKEVDKSIVAGIPFVDGANFMKNTISGWENMKEHYQPRTFHIAKINQSGKMKDRWFVVDAIRNKDKAQVLLMWDKNGVDGILE
jgi:uncharacterized protein (DUF2344 family)